MSTCAKKKSGSKMTANVRSIGRSGDPTSLSDNGLQASLIVLKKQVHALTMSASSKGGLLVSRAAITNAYPSSLVQRDNGDAWSRESLLRIVI